MNRELINEELRQGKRKSAKPMLWVSMISMVMFFAALTSAYVISMNREDWVTFDLPQAFYISTVLILLSSASLFISTTTKKRRFTKVFSLFNTYFCVRYWLCLVSICRI